MICPSCNTDNRDGAKFCDECGARLIVDNPVVNQETQSFDAVDEAVAAGNEEEQAVQDAAVINDSEEVDFGEFDPDAVAGQDEPGPEPAPEPETSSLAGLDVSVPIIFDPVPLNNPNSSDITREIPVVGYTKPESAWKSGGTLEMPRVDAPEGSSTNTDFRAPDINDRKNRKRQAKELRKQQKAAERAAQTADGKPARPSGLVIGIVALVAVLAIAGGTYMLELWGGKSVPDVAGKTEADAAYILEKAGFTVRQDTVPSDDTEGLVLMSDPAAGARVQPGSEVLVHVATARTIPDVVGKSEAEALAMISKMGYTNVGDIVYEKSDDSDGIALKIEPTAGVKAKSGTKITLTVSQAYSVPDVTSLSEAAAVEAVVEAGLNPIVSYVQNPDHPEGFAFATDPIAGTKVKSGSNVTISVATSRATELVRKTTAFLEGGGGLTYDGYPVEIVSVDSVNYEGAGTVSFTVTGQPVVTILGESFRLSPRQITGVATFDDNDQLISVG